jgi:hypothetical protein
MSPSTILPTFRSERQSTDNRIQEDAADMICHAEVGGFTRKDGSFELTHVSLVPGPSPHRHSSDVVQVPRGMLTDG